MINEFNVGETFKDLIVYCVSKQTKVAKNGSSFYDLTLQDKSGQVNGKIWEIDKVPEFEERSFIKINGNVSSFNGNNQFSILSCSVIDEELVNIDDFCPITPYDIDGMYNELMILIDSIHDKYLHTLLMLFFDNEAFKTKFKKSSAAKAVHHNYIGGLLEHTLSVTKICNFAATLYPVNRDLLLTAAICHDIGKLKELDLYPINDYTDEGNLLGHVYMSTEMVDVQARKIDHFPKQLLNELKHCILAHHGQLEYGSPKLPALIEAIILSQADNMDAKAKRFEELLENADNGWQSKDFFLNTTYRKSYREE